MSPQSGGPIEYVPPDERATLIHEGVGAGANLTNEVLQLILDSIRDAGPPGTRANVLAGFRGACACYVAGRLLLEDARARLSSVSTNEDLAATLDRCADILLAARAGQARGEHEEPSRN